MASAHVVDESILEPFTYISETPGKDVRGQLVDAFQVWLRIPPDRLEAIKNIVSSLHNASLLVDDIEDGSNLRRGVPVAHAIYGVPSTLNCANYVYFIALEQAHALSNSEALSVFVAEMLNLHRGQGQDILWRDAVRCPSEVEYTRMVLDKTGGLFRLAVGMMAAFSTTGKTNDDFRKLVDLLALYFQIRDDLVNLRSEEYMQSKSYCEDLTEGKFSYPIIHAIQSVPGDHRLLNILKQRTASEDVKRHAVDFMERAGSFAHTRAALLRIHADIASEIAHLGGHPALENLVARLHRQIIADPAPPPAENSSPTVLGHLSNNKGPVDSL